jgi:transcription-repair coupling factor (superfamily II helicase)
MLRIGDQGAAFKGLSMINSNIHVDNIKKELQDSVKKLHIIGPSGSARAFLLSRLLVEAERPYLIILPSANDAARLYRELEFFFPESYTNTDPGVRRLYDFPGYDISPLAGLSPHRNIISRRIQSMYALASEDHSIIVTSADAILYKVLPKKALIKGVEYLEAGEDVEREELLKKLETGGYLRTSLVEEMGDYSVRGGVIDIFPPLYAQPVRLEFWGERLESIRHFDPLTQRATGPLNETLLLPANEIILGQDNMERARSMGRLPVDIKETGGFPGQEAWLNHFYPELATIFDYLPDNGLIISFDLHRVSSEMDRLTEKSITDKERYRLEAEERHAPFPDTDGTIIENRDFSASLDRYQLIEFSELPMEASGENMKVLEIKGSSGIDFELELRLAGKGKVSMAPLADRISEWKGQGARVILVCRTKQQADRLQEILANYNVDIEEIATHWYRLSARKGISICLGRLSKGFAWPGLGMYVVSEDEIFGAKQPKARTKERPVAGALDWTSFSQLKVGDLVVHQEHGIGRYGGLINIEIEQKANDFLLIEYAGNDRLYTPADRISIIQKYVGADETDPRLDRLGGQSWDIAKQKAKKSVQEIAKQLVEIYALRKHRKGFAFSMSDNYFREFEATFEYEETPDQIKSINDILSDMESDRPMDRLVCGDVGFGKTEVAIRAAFKAVMDGKQVALLVPTTVLAEQHYETIRKRMSPYEIRVGVLSRFKSRVQQKELIAKVRSGNIDIIIGTHRILQRDVGFKDLGLLIIDEEQRFGVRQKEQLKKYRALVDVLALTATPIPRSFHMSLMGVRDLSIIETPPEDRMAINTYLSHYDEQTIRRAIEAEIARKGQVFFVHNRVQNIKEIEDRLTQIVPAARFAIAHGQMKGKDLEDTMMRFLHKEIDVLICTTIIESGLDIPSSNTIIINEVDRLGLSQIYQLRGRVGRSAEKAYAYLILSDDAKMTKQAEKRLKALMDFSHLGAGINLAMHDLKIRGGGNILGFSQSGHVAAIGYELYTRLIEQSVAELKGEDWHEDVNPEINVDIPAYLPEDYISDIDVRLNIYRRLSGLEEDADLKIMTEEIKDRFGPPVPAVANLLEIMEVRLKLKKLSISRLDVSPQVLTFSFLEKTKVRPERLIELVNAQKFKFQLESATKLKARIRKETPLEALYEAGNIIRDLADF